MFFNSTTSRKYLLTTGFLSQAMLAVARINNGTSSGTDSDIAGNPLTLAAITLGMLVGCICLYKGSPILARCLRVRY